jgi:hypothetical protein
LPTITPGRALTTAIPVELLLVPLGIAVAWMEAGRFRVLHRTHKQLSSMRHEQRARRGVQ